MPTWLTAGLKAIAGWFDWLRTKEDQLAGANKVKVAQYEEGDKIRKDAAAVRAKPKRNRLQRNKGKGGK